jgi:cysteine desulfurase
MAAVALEAESNKGASEIDMANRTLRDILSQIDDVDIAGHESGDRLSFSFLHVPADELVRRLATDGFLVDSGSACSSSELSPSHVLEAMGILTHGNIRLRLRDENLHEIQGLAVAISRHVAAIRGELL